MAIDTSESPGGATRELITASAALTEAAGARLAATLMRGDLVLLAGTLGAGKTTFVRGIAAGLGVGGHVSSPTFQLVRTHRAGGRGLALAHLDLYRLQDTSELADLGLEQLLEEGVAVVEWGDRLQPSDLEGAFGRIRFELVNEHGRRLRVERGPDRWSL